jgi:prenyltransferase beta subunit
MWRWTLGLLLNDGSVRNGAEGIVDQSKYYSGIVIKLLRKAFEGLNQYSP